MGRGDTFEFFQYNSDDGSAYAIKLTDAVAVQGGFGTVVSPASLKVWPYGARNLRHVYGKATTGQRTRLPISSAADSLYTSGGSFSLGGVSYTCEGQIGEARKKNAIA